MASMDTSDSTTSTAIPLPPPPAPQDAAMTKEQTDPAQETAPNVIALGPPPGSAVEPSSVTQDSTQDNNAGDAPAVIALGPPTTSASTDGKEAKEATSTASDTPKPKRKRSRWGRKADGRAKKSRWSNESEKVAIPAGAAAHMSNLTPQQREAFLVRLQIDTINRKLLNVKLLIPPNPDDRSPSPEPVYDGNGKRLNTREMRIRDKLIKERTDLIRKAMKDIPGFQPPSGMKVDTRVSKKLPIPVDKFPDYNFIGLIIGPRGNTQKRMEKETGCKIAIRGKGSVKAGKAKAFRHQQDENEPIHVLIQADDEEKLNKAVKMIEKLLIPVDEDKNEHKAKQLRELAAINGTLREEVICRVCGEPGHKIYECPNRSGATWTPANVLCDICGAASHPTNDCPQKGNKNATNLDAEYSSFMAELTGGGPNRTHAAIKALPAPPPSSSGTPNGQSQSGPPPPPPSSSRMPPTPPPMGPPPMGRGPPPPQWRGPPGPPQGYGYGPPQGYGGYGGYGYGAPPPPPPMRGGYGYGGAPPQGYGYGYNQGYGSGYAQPPPPQGYGGYPNQPPPPQQPPQQPPPPQQQPPPPSGPPPPTTDTAQQQQPSA